MKKLILTMMLIGILALSGCSSGDTTQANQVTGAAVTETAAATDSCANCDDNNKCTQDVCNEGTNYECKYKVITPCCGNDKCEEGENSGTCSADCKAFIGISEEIQSMVENQAKVKSYWYTKFGDTIAKKIYVKGDMIRIDLTKEKSRSFTPMNKYDTVFLDTAKKKAYITCMDVTICEDRRNIVDDADYNEYKPQTPMEIIQGAIFTGETVATELCDNNKPCSKISAMFADGSEGYVWMDSYYGFPYNVQKGSAKYEFYTVAINAVKDSDVTLP